jgi:antitoxin (DNA-binding transcriptional repressor) of toxin-antitoxin stability system
MELRANLRELPDHAAADETIQIRRRGRPVAQLAPVLKPLKPIDMQMLRRLTEGMPLQNPLAISSGGCATATATEILYTSSTSTTPGIARIAEAMRGDTE